MIARLTALIARVAALGRRRRLDRDLEDDLQAHFGLLVDDLVAHGMEPAAARREARLRFGTTASAMDAHRDARSLPFVETFARDVRYGARLLRRQPGLMAAVVVMLAIGIAVPASVLSLLHGFLFRAPVSRDPAAFARLIRPGESSAGTASLAEYHAFTTQSTTFRTLAAWSGRDLQAPLGAEDPTLVSGLLVSCNLLQLYGVDRPAAGRLFVDDDCRSDVPVAILSESIWRSRFGADPAVVGRTIPYGSARIIVAGVADAPSFIHEWDDADLVVGVWLPYTAQAALAQMSAFDGSNMLSARNEHRPWLELAGLLAPGVSRQAAAADLRRIQASVPAPDRQRERPLDLSDGSRWASVDADDAWGIYVMGLILPLIVMLMTCVNAAALLLSRAVSRQQEMALRRALGTNRAGLFRMLLTEHLVIAAIAGVVSLALVYSLPPVIVWQFDVARTFGDAATLRPDWRVFVAIGMAVLLAAVLSGLTPAREALRPQAGDSLLNRLGTLSRPRVRSRRLLVGVQLAACMVPLVVAMTFARAADRYTRLGFWRGDLLVANVPVDGSRQLSLAEIAAGLSREPGVDAVTFVDWLPLVFEGAERMRIPGRDEQVVAVRTRIGSGFFDVFDLPILAGESGLRPTPDEQAGSVIVSRQFARRFFGELNTLGQVIAFPYDRQGTRQVIAGIAGDRPVGRAMFGGALMDGSALYTPMPADATSGILVVRPSAPADVAMAALAPALRDLVGMPIPVTTYQARLDERVAVVRDVQMLLIVLGAVALVLAVIAVGGSLAFEANQRRKEFAVQMALGAAPWDVRRGVIRAGLRPVPVSLAVGLLASWVAVRGGLEYFRILPGGSMGADPLPYALVTLALAAVAVVTLVAIAWPVGRRDPLPALREE